MRTVRKGLGFLIIAAGMAPAPVLAATPLGAAAPDAAAVTVTARSRPDLFGTVALPVSGGRWADKFNKVASASGVPAVLAEFIAPARNLPRWQQMRFVQAGVDHRIGWRSDGTQYGVRTYWADAQETLGCGFGDDNDRAILKYQALRALGVPSADMFLMIGRDAVRGGDYTLLAVRSGGRTFLLEERGSEPVAIEQRTGFSPQISFSGRQAWIHGRRMAAQTDTASVISAGLRTDMRARR
jgi:predicted transglutaminase-like cysteine proteinase